MANSLLAVALVVVSALFSEASAGTCYRFKLPGGIRSNVYTGRQVRFSDEVFQTRTNVKFVKIMSRRCEIEYCGFIDPCGTTVLGRPNEVVTDNCGTKYTVGPQCQTNNLMWDTVNTLSIEQGKDYKHNCVPKLDVCFAIDESYSLGRIGFLREIQAARSITVRLINKTPQDAGPRFSGFLFDSDIVGSGDTVQDTPTNDYRLFLANLNGMEYNAGWTNISAGLDFCKNSLSDSSRTRMVILLTDGVQSVDANGNDKHRSGYNVNAADWKSAEENGHVYRLAKRMNEDGIAVAVVGLFDTEKPATSQIRDFFGECAAKSRSQRPVAKAIPNHARALYYEYSLDQMTNVVRDIASEVCDEEVSIFSAVQAPSPSPAPPVVWDPKEYIFSPGSKYDGQCVGDLDVCIAIDESGSVTAKNFGNSIAFARSFVHQLVARMPTSKPPRFSGFIFDEDTHGSADAIQQELSSDYVSFMKSMNVIKYNGGWTNISDGLFNCRESLSASNRNKIVLVLTDGIQSVDANGDDSGSSTYNSHTGGFNATEENAAVKDLAREMVDDDGIVIAVIGLYATDHLSDTMKNFLTGFASQATSKRPACNTRDSLEDRSLFYSFPFSAMSDAAAKTMADEFCDQEVSILPGLLTSGGDNMCQCVKYTSMTPGYCVRVVDDPNAVSGTSTCEYDACSEDRFTCDVVATNALCRRVADMAWVCINGTHRNDGTCDCQMKTVDRVVFERFL